MNSHSLVSGALPCLEHRGWAQSGPCKSGCPCPRLSYGMPAASLQTSLPVLPPVCVRVNSTSACCLEPVQTSFLESALSLRLNPGKGHVEPSDVMGSETDSAVLFFFSFFVSRYVCFRYRRWHGDGPEFTLKFTSPAVIGLKVTPILYPPEVRATLTEGEKGQESAQFFAGRPGPG